ncbi:endonuclease [Marinomonas sp. 2405UD68-3]
MSSQQIKLMNAWNAQYPVSDWECKRASRIEKIQGNKNSVLNAVCD